MGQQTMGDTIDRLALLELRPRDFPTYGLVEKLYLASRQKNPGPQCLRAAEELRKVVGLGHHVILITGFAVPPFIVAGETDGPLGAASLTRALTLGFGASATILTDDMELEVVKATCRAAELRVVEAETQAAVPRSVSVQPFPLAGGEESRRIANQMLDEIRPSAVISIERAGHNSQGVYHTAFGYDMTQWTARTDYVMDEAKARKILTIGIGDWGNEAGLGGLASEVREIMPNAATCKCPCKGGIATAVESDIPLVFTCSNFGAYGVTACIAYLLNRHEILQHLELEQEMLNECRRSGAVEAVQATPSLRVPVDMIPKDAYLSVLALMHAVLEQTSRRTPLDRAEMEQERTQTCR